MSRPPPASGSGLHPKTAKPHHRLFENDNDWICEIVMPKACHPYPAAAASSTAAGVVLCRVTVIAAALPKALSRGDKMRMSIASMWKPGLAKISF